MIKTYSHEFDGTKQISRNFKVSEFACPDGTDKILIDDNLVLFLQAIRDYFGQPIDVGSGYRTKTYNKLIGGDPDSAHMEGQAADIDVGRNKLAIPACIVAMFAEAYGIKRIGLYLYADGRSWIHIGSGQTKLFWFDSASGKRIYPKTFLPTLRWQAAFFTNAYEVAVAQTILAKHGFYAGKIDGRYGPGTSMKKAVLAFQKAKGLQQDSNIGPATWRALFAMPW